MSNIAHNLQQLAGKLMDRQDIRGLFEQTVQQLDSIEPDDVFEAMNNLLLQGREAGDILAVVDKVIHIIHLKLAGTDRDKLPSNPFLLSLDDENQALLNRLEAFKSTVKAQQSETLRQEGLNLLQTLDSYQVHFQKLENILFPELEKKHPRFAGLSILWALHDKIRVEMKKTRLCLSDPDVDLATINRQIGRLYFLYFGFVQKQDLLLFPSAIRWLNRDEFQSMFIQCFDYGFAWIEPPARPPVQQAPDFADSSDQWTFRSPTGSLSIQQLTEIFRRLPVDITVVDEQDQVVYFSDNPDRIFPRSPAIIGRKVQNCHPPKSMHAVEQILKRFKAGDKDQESFWINLHSQKILIQYFALRDPSGRYLGTLEASQDITVISQLSGEKRLLDDQQP